MTRSIALLVVCALFATQPAVGEDLSAEKMRALASQKDDRSKVPEALKIYPAAIEYSISVRVAAPGEQPKDSPKVIAREALVEGKYLVTQFRPPMFKADLITVIYFDEAQDCYRSATLLPDGSLSRSIGTKNRDSRVISWATTPSADEKKPAMVLSQEVLSDNERRWHEITVDDGKVVVILEGVATVTRKPK